MSISSISSNAAPVNVAAPVKAKTPAEIAASQSATAATTTASTIKAALQEATETAAETAKEAGLGDHQAQTLVAKHAHHAEPQQSTATASKAAPVVNASGQITGEIINTKA